jgi:hypothetical protein
MIVEGPGDLPGDVVAPFSGPAGEQLVLVRTAAKAGARPATLEEVVLGYLSAGRATETAESGWAV